MENNTSAQQTAVNAQAQKSKPKKFMFLRLGNATFAIPLSQVREVIGLSQMSSLPNMPDYFAGLLNLRGKIVSAILLRKSLGLNPRELEKHPESKRPCIVITELDGNLYGAIVDDVVEVQAISEADIDMSMEGAKRSEGFAGMIKRQGSGLAPILNLKEALRIHELLQLVA